MEGRDRSVVRRRFRRTVAAGLLAACVSTVAHARPGAGDPATPPEVFPVGETLGYAVTFMGIRCGTMEITSYVEDTPAGPIYRIVVLARTTSFFDGIYRVRSRIDSYFDPRRMSSVRYEEHSIEKKKRKDEVYVVDEKAGEVIRTKNGERSVIPIDVDRANDPLSFIYRLRTMDAGVGDELVLGLMTSKGVVETLARVTERKQVRTKMGKCDAYAVTPEPRDKMMFSKSGSMVVWIDRAPPRRPCRIEFDLSFGKLIAKIATVEDAPPGGVEDDWETWEGTLEDDE